MTAKLRERYRHLGKAAVCLLLAGTAAATGYYLYRRHLMANFHTVAEGLVYRSAQPTAGELAEWHRQYGIRAIINLRGEPDQPEFAEECAVADRLGIELRTLALSAAEQPSAITLRELLRLVETAPRPVLLHCLAGIDRTGLASVVAKMAIGGATYREALDQLSLRYFHLDRNPDRLPGVLARYEEWCRATGRDTAGYRQFKTWVETVYHPYYYKVCIAAPSDLTLAPGEQATLDVVVENCSNRTIPAADPRKTFTLAVFTGSSVEQKPDAELGPRLQLPRRDLVAGEKIALRQPLIAPPTPGSYLVHYDLVEENRTWFAKQGSPVPTLRLTVR